MIKMVQLTMVTGAARQDEQVSEGQDHESGEDDGLSNVVSLPTPAPAPVEQTSPVMVDASKVRAFYPRKPRHDGTPRVGTRLTFDNGSGMAVTEDFNEVAAKFGRSN